MKISKLIEQLQEISDRYNGNINVVLEYKFGNKIMINSRPKIYTKCIYYKNPKIQPYWLTKIWELNVVLSNRVKLYNDKHKSQYKLGKNNL